MDLIRFFYSPEQCDNVNNVINIITSEFESGLSSYCQ